MRCISHGLKIKPLNMKRKSKMKPNNEIQTIPSCGNCKKVKELEAEIKKLDELVSWIENKAFEYEDEAYRLRKQLNNVSPKL